ncbi:hypothetical protein ABES02_29740 [Neobacillus pocheonensis]|uniref:hypothetical protein n=1 Tax=Neobacillus pocheonensis TaxID=363869 RepID=UPI003D291C29
MRPKDATAAGRWLRIQAVAATTEGCPNPQPLGRSGRDEAIPKKPTPLERNRKGQGPRSRARSRAPVRFATVVPSAAARLLDFSAEEHSPLSYPSS